MICLNDVDEYDHQEFEQLKTRINQAFDEILPERSAFEKQTVVSEPLSKVI